MPRMANHDKHAKASENNTSTSRLLFIYLKSRVSLVVLHFKKSNCSEKEMYKFDNYSPNFE